MYTKPPVVPAWAETAANPADIVTMTNGEVQSGWPNTGVPPSRQKFNFVLNFLANAVRYFCQRGIPDYDPLETYAINSLTIGDDGNTYKSLANANTNNLPSTHPASWVRWGFSLAQINASQLTQPNLPAADDSTKVANSHFVMQLVAGMATQAWVAAYIAGLNLATQAWVTAQFAVQSAWENATFATIATVNALTASLTNGLAIQYGTNGYIKLPAFLGSIIIQWCQAGADAGGEHDVAVGFPLAFPNQCMNLQVSMLGPDTNANDSWYQIISFNQFGATIRKQTTGGTTQTSTAMVLAIGY